MDALENLKQRFRNAGIVEKLIYINLAVFLSVFLVNTFGFLFQSKSNFLIQWFALPADLEQFMNKPWTLVTYGFLHAGFLHILLNLIVLYWVGRLFIDYFTPKQLLNFYILGTFCGGLVYVGSYNFFPVFQNMTNGSILVGASAGISAIFMGVATYMPNYEIKFPLIGFVKLWVLACVWIALDVIQIPAGNAGGHLAHLGGALFGFCYVYYASNKEITTFSWIGTIFRKKEKKLKTVHKSGRKTTKTAANKATKSKTQQEIDAILDKISKSGYDTLSKEEKEFLFKQGKK